MSYTPPAVGQGKRVTQVTYQPTITPNSTTTDIMRVLLTGSPTLQIPSGSPYDGQQMLLEFTQDATGNRTVTWGAGYSFGDDVPTPTLSAAAGKIDTVLIQFSAQNGKWKVLASLRGYN